MTSNPIEDAWVPDACTLPTVDQPLRRAEFDDLFAHDLLAVHHAPHELRLELRADPEVAARAAGLAARETGCCSFFTFELALTGGKVSLIVSTSAVHQAVLAALGASAESRLGAGA